VQFATEFTSLAAPRTVLHAAAANAAPIKSAVATLWNILTVLLVCQSNAIEPNALHCAFAIVTPINAEPSSDGDWRGYVRVGIVVFEQEIFGLVAEQSLSPILDHQTRQRLGLARQLQPGLFEMV